MSDEKNKAAADKAAADNKATEAADKAAAKTTKEPSIDEQLEAAKATVSQLEASKKEADAKARAEAAAEELKNDKRPVFTAPDKRKFRFVKTAPETLNIDGTTKKLKDIISSKEAMLELIEGNSNLIEQIHI